MLTPLGYLALSARVAVAGLLVIAAAAKMRDLRGFAAALDALRAVPGPFRRRRRVLRAVAAVVVGVEAAIATLVIVPSTATAGLALAVPLFTALSAVAVRSARSGVRSGVGSGVGVPCPCFGRAKAPLGWPHAIRNAAFALLAATGLFGQLVEGGHPPQAGPSVLAVGLALVVVAAGVLLDDLVTLFRDPAPRTKETTGGSRHRAHRPAVRTGSAEPGLDSGDHPQAPAPR